MTVELICVGTELLLGNIVNTNAAWLAEQCAALGLSCYYQTVVGDNAQRLAGILRTGLERSDILILSGGLGPTQDDLTKETVAQVCARRLTEDAGSLSRIEEYFRERGLRMTDNNRKQALVPEGAVVVDNDNGTAPGLILEKDGKRIILLPGPPNELIPMFEKKIAPYLLSLDPDGPSVIYSRTVKICGLGESGVETMITDLEALTNPTVAPYAKTGEVHLRVTARAAEEKEAKKLVKPVVKELERRFGRSVYTTKNEVTLEEAVVKLLKKHDLTVSTVESCTGGLAAGRLVNVPGVSDVFKAGFITYSNKAKRKVLDVSKATLKKYGAVSEQTAKEMAKGGVFASDSDICVAVTGFAGPEDTKEEPKGLAYISCYIGNEVVVREFHFTGNRMKIREQAVVRALDLLRRCILERCKNEK